MFGPKLRSPKAIEKRRKIRLVKTGVFGGAAFLVVLVIVGISHMSALRIDNVTVEGANSVTPEEVAGVALGALEGNRLGLFPRANTLFYSKRALRAAVLDGFPRAKSIDIEREGLNTLHITMYEREPFALWCGDIVPVFVDSSDPTYGTCYFLDQEGYIFTRANDTEAASLHRFYGAISRGKEVGQHFIEKDEFHRIHAFMTELTEAEIVLLGLLLVDDAELELYLGAGPRVLIQRQDDLMQVKDTLLSVLGADVLEGRISQLEYIDLRFGNKVYFREGAR